MSIVFPIRRPSAEFGVFETRSVPYRRYAYHRRAGLQAAMLDCVNSTKYLATRILIATALRSAQQGSSGGLASDCQILRTSSAYDERTSAPDGGLDLEREGVDSRFAV